MTQHGTEMNESHLVEEFSKGQPPINESEYQNVESVKKIIYRYQNKVQDMLKVIKHQKKNNDHLKSQLKNLNETLNHLVEKLNIKGPKKQDDLAKDQAVKKELENQVKRNLNLKKEVDVLRAKIKMYESQKIGDMHNEIRQKDKIIEELQNNIKMYEKLGKKEMNSDIYKKQQEATTKINSLNEEIIHLKKKFNQLKKAEEVNERSSKIQHQKILALEGKTRSISQHASQQKKSQEVSKQKHNEIQFKKLKDNYESLQYSKKTIQKTSKIEIDGLKTRNKILEKQLEELKLEGIRRQKQIAKIKHMHKTSMNSLLEPFDKERSPEKTEDWFLNSSIADVYDCRKQFRGVNHLQNANRKFDDSTELPLEKNYKISKLVFKYFEEHILELLTEYQILNNSSQLGQNDSKSARQTKKITSFQITSVYNNIRVCELVLSDYQYIKECQIFTSIKGIQCIRMRTSKDQVIEVGNQKSIPKCKRHSFDIKAYEKPIAFMGVIEKRSAGEKEKEMLINLGLILKKKDIFSRSKSQYKVELRKHPSKSALKIQNDKNTE